MKLADAAVLYGLKPRPTTDELGALMHEQVMNVLTDYARDHDEFRHRWVIDILPVHQAFDPLFELLGGHGQVDRMFYVDNHHSQHVAGLLLRDLLISVDNVNADVWDGLPDNDEGQAHRVLVYRGLDSRGLWVRVRPTTVLRSLLTSLTTLLTPP